MIRSALVLSSCFQSVILKKEENICNKKGLYKLNKIQAITDGLLINLFLPCIKNPEDPNCQIPTFYDTGKAS